MDQVNIKRQGAPQPVQRVVRRRPNNNRLIAIIVAVVILLGAGGFVCKKYMFSQGLFTKDIKHNQYQAVFLSNGQVYFGKLDDLKRDYMKLSNIYYLQVQQAVQPAETKTDSTQQQQLQLAKLGGELHGPEDSMYISTKQVLFWENLKDDSQVVKAIKTAK